jgi:hypothetical protein
MHLDLNHIGCVRSTIQIVENGIFGSLVFVSPPELCVILNTLSQMPLIFKQYSVIAVLVIIPRIVLSIRHIGKVSNTHDLTRLSRSWVHDRTLKYGWRQIWWQTVVAHPFKGSDRSFGSNFQKLADLPCAPSPPKAEFAFHLNVIVLSDSWRVWTCCQNSFSPLGVALSWCSLKIRIC